MNNSEVTRLIGNAATGDIDAYMKLYRAVYKPLYKIAVISTVNRQLAAFVTVKTACDGFTKLSKPEINRSSGFMEWIIRILCENIKQVKAEAPEAPDKTEQALLTLTDMERLVLAVSTICGCNADKTAKLCGYNADTISVCLANAEFKLKPVMMN